MAEKKLRVGRIVGALALLLALLAGALFLARHSIATSIAEGQLEERGIRCENLVVRLSATFSEAEVLPTRCTFERGIVEAIDLVGAATVQLEGTEPTLIQLGSVQLALRDQDLRGGTGWAGPLRQLGLEQKVAGLVKGVSEVGGLGLPETAAATAEILHGGQRLALVSSLRLRPAETGSDIEIGRLSFSAGPMNSGRLTLSSLRVQASPARVHMAGQAEGSVGIGPLRMARTGRFVIDATGLDTASPSFSLEGDF